MKKRTSKEILESIVRGLPNASIQENNYTLEIRNNSNLFSVTGTDLYDRMLDMLLINGLNKL